MTRKLALVALAGAVLLAIADHVFIIAAVVIALALAASSLAWWAFRPQGSLPRHRARHLRWRLRLRLRLHPGRGHATKSELWMRWGRLASFRESRRTRPSLSRWHRMTHAAEHSHFIGRAHHRHGLRVPVQEHGCVVGPPRSYKSALLSRIVMGAPRRGGEHEQQA
jgi:hypothetical protein